MRNVYEFLKGLDIPYETYSHPAVFTVEEANLACEKIPGKQAKNLFLTNEKGTAHFLVTMAHDKQADLKELGRWLGEKRLRFASPERLQKYLGVTPGSVSPLGLMNDLDHHVAFVIGADLMEQEKIYVHPNMNNATLGIRINDFKKFLAATGHEAKIFGEGSQ